MNKHIITTGILLLIGGGAWADDTNAPAPAASAPVSNSGPSFDAFSRILRERNIFNANRVPRTRGSDGGGRNTPQPRPEYFTLRGTMSYDDEKYAFFEGTSSQYRRAFKPADRIGGYKIAAIQADRIKLSAEGDKTIELVVGAQMRRVDGGPWSLVANADGGDSADVSTNSDQSSSNATSSSASSGPVSDIMKRMMERRERGE